MRRPRNFQTDRCYHLVNRVGHRAFYLDEYEPWHEVTPPLPLHQWGQTLWRSLLGTNVGIVVLRGFPKDSPPAFVTDAITEHRYWSCSGMQGTDYIFPLYLYEENMGKVERRANLDREIVAKIAAAVGGETASVQQQEEEVCALEIFDYIYGVLHSPAYRAKFKEFLKSDFPRIPYPKDAEVFALYRDAGRELRMAHLMLDPPPTLSEPTARFPVPGDNVVENVASVKVLPISNSNSQLETGKIGNTSICRVYINPTQYFDNVPLAAYEQAIGGYYPAEKWLKDRKGRALTQDDLRHYQRIILALVKTCEIMKTLH